MKTKTNRTAFLILLIITTLFVGLKIGSAQTKTLTEHWTLQPNQEEHFDSVYLNGYNIDMRNNSTLIMNNVFGSGNISTQSNGSGSNQPVLVINESYTCDVTFNGNQSYSELDAPLNCDTTLSVPSNELDINNIEDGLRYYISYLDGKVFRQGKTGSNMLEGVNIGVVFILKVEGYKAVKLLQ